MYLSSTVIDRALSFCRAVLPEPLATGLDVRAMEWVCEREIDRFADLHRINPAAGTDLTREEARGWVERFRQASSNLLSYRTRIEVRDILGAEPERASPDLVWIGTVVLPNRFHVRQIAGDDYDEWITIGDATWDSLAVMLGVTSPDPDSRRPLTNRELLIDRWSQAAFVESPSSGLSHRLRGQEIVQLSWDELSSESAALVLGQSSSGDDSVTKKSMQVWLLESGRFARADMTVTDDQGCSSVFTQRVAMCDYPFTILDPTGRRSS